MRELWAAYSVGDHLMKKAFVADVMLYDKLVIPTPAEDDRARWEAKGWNEARQKRIIKILGPRAHPVVWDAALRAIWQSEWQAAQRVGAQTSRDGMRITSALVLRTLPPGVTGVMAVAAYDTPEELCASLHVQEIEPVRPGCAPRNPIAGALAAVIGREFLVPDDGELDEEELLRQAVQISSDTHFRRKRAAYWRWQNEFLRDATIFDQRAIEDAIEEMNDLIADEKAQLIRSNVKLAASFSFAVGLASVGMLTDTQALALAPLGVAAAFLSVGGWVIDHLPDMPGVGADAKPTALCMSARRHFGWQG